LIQPAELHFGTSKATFAMQDNSLSTATNQAEKYDAFEFLRFFDLVVNSSASAIEKLTALVIGRHLDGRGDNAYPARKRIIQQASISLDSFKRAAPVVQVFLDPTPRRGRSTVYAAKPVTATEVEEAILSLTRMRDASRSKSDAHSAQVAHSTQVVGGTQHPTRAEPGCTEPPRPGCTEPPHNEPRKKGSFSVTESEIPLSLSKEDSSLRSESTPASPADSGDDLTDDRVVWGACAKWLIETTGKSERSCKSLIGKWVKVLSYHELREAFRTCWRAKVADPVTYIAAIVSKAERTALERCRRENGQLVVVNGFKADLEGILQGRDLQRSLAWINGKIPQSIVGPDLEARVKSLAIEMVDRVAEQDRRYASAIKMREKAKEDDIWAGVL